MLTTPTAIVHGLGELGIQWEATAHDFTEPAKHSEPGLYTWVDGCSNAPIMERPILYIGVATGAGGLGRRLANEMSWGSGDFIHGHGRAVHNRAASAVSGSLSQELVDLEWMNTQFEVANPQLEPAVEWLSASSTTLIRRAEILAIRLSLHLGHTVAPVNSQHGGAWESTSCADFLAYRVSERMN
jgi:hypothetical protein